ncbi:MAG: hypothetical protein J6L75_02835 [Alistipes sp.]|nr:hypothetical protein [Alistipes sp.]
MIRYKIIIAGIACALLTVTDAAAQDVVARIPELGQNKNYMELLRRDELLQMRSDSLINVMRGVRLDMRTIAEQRDTLMRNTIDSLSTVLADVEEKMIELRSEKVKLVDNINAIEQEFLLSSMDNIGGVESQASSSIYNNEYFRNSLFDEDYEVLMNVHKREAEARDYVKMYVENYKKIESLYDKYLKAATESESEDIYAEISVAMDENMVLDRRLAKLWTEIFDQKTYVYSYFLEKEGREDILELTENMTSEARQMQAMAVDNCASEAVADYCLQKPVVLNYEMYVAKMLDLPKTIDSLSSASRAVRQVDYRMPVIDVERRSFVDYAAIEFRSRSPYTSSNPVPDCIVYEYGTIYRILLGMYKVRQATSIFRGAVPLSVDVEDDGRFSYYAGGLRTLAEAEAAVAVMKKKGFRNPRIVEWVDGYKTNITEMGEGGRISYRIVITGSKLDETVQEIISSMAPDCQVSKIADDTFLVGMFGSKALAQRVADAIAKCDEGLTIEISEIKSEVTEEEE